MKVLAQFFFGGEAFFLQVSAYSEFENIDVFFFKTIRNFSEF